MPHKVWLLHGCSFLAVIGLLVIAQVQGWFAIQEVECQLDDSACPDAVRNRLNPLTNISYFFSNLPQETTEILGDQAYAVLAVNRVRPWVVKVELTQIGTYYQLNLPDGQQLQVTPAGATESPTTPSIPQVTVITTPAEILNNNQVYPQFHQALSLAIQELNQQEISWRSITVVSLQEILIELDDGRRVIIDTTVTAKALQLIPSILAHESVQQLSPQIKELDLRFNLPVLRTELSGD